MPAERAAAMTATGATPILDATDLDKTATTTVAMAVVATGATVIWRTVAVEAKVEVDDVMVASVVVVVAAAADVTGGRSRHRPRIRSGNQHPT